MAKAAGFSVNDRNIRDLKVDSPVLKLIREGFEKILDADKFRVSTFQESLGYSSTGLLDGKIVPNDSSEIGHARNERVNFINANHMNMCKFKDAEDDGYKMFRAEIRRHISRSQPDPVSQETQETEANDLAKCIQSFFIPEMDIREIQIEAAQKKTLEWLYEEPGPGLAEWLKFGSRVFWIYGKAGSGKSTAMKFLLQNRKTLSLLRHDDMNSDWLVLGCFFTDRAGRVQSSWLGILHAILYKLLSKQRSLAEVALNSWRRLLADGKIPTELGQETSHVTGLPFSGWNVDSLEEILLAIRFKIEAHKRLRVCFFIDALDEHDGNHRRMCNFLQKLASSTCVHLKICVASRPENDLKDAFGSDPSLKIQDWMKRDIDAYISERLSKKPRWMQISKGEGLEAADRLTTSISERSSGVFLWVRLVLDELMQGVSDGLSIVELEELTNAFPDDLTEFFSHMLEKVNKKHWSETAIIVETLLRNKIAPAPSYLEFVLQANLKPVSRENVRPMHLTHGFDLDGFSRRLQSRCGGLVEIVPGFYQDTHLVQFLHQTVKEYFLENENLKHLLESMVFFAPGVTKANGHFFILQAFLHDLYHQSQKTPLTLGGSIQADIATIIFHHAIAIETTFGISPTHLLNEIDLLISKFDPRGTQWAFEAVSLSDFRSKFANVFLSPRQSLFITAKVLGLNLYASEELGEEMSSAVHQSGAVQLAFIPCRSQDIEAQPLTESVSFLTKIGMDVKTCVSLGSTDQGAVPFDGLRIFTSSHVSCDWSHHDEEHVKVFSTLLELGTDPCGHYFKRYDNVPPIFLAALSIRLGEKRIEVLDTLWSHASRRSKKAAILFNQSKGKILDMEAFKDEADDDIFQWFFDHGAVISTTLARDIGEPLTDRENLSRQSGSLSTYSAACQMLSLREITRDALESSLINTWIYDLDKEFCAGYRILLSDRFRIPKYYAPNAQTVAAKFNPDWEKKSWVGSYNRNEGTRGRSTQRVWKSLFSFGRLN